MTFNEQLLAVILAVADGLAVRGRMKRANVLREGMKKHKFEESRDYD